MTGKTAIITGASSGIGREFALQIAQSYRSIEEIWLIARRKERLEELEGMLLGKRVRVLALDLQQPQCLEELAALLEREKPQIKILVNAAGYGIIGKVMETEEQENIGMIDLNCRALTAVTYMALPYMVRKGVVVQMASSAAFLPQPGFAVYAASKAYVLSFSRALAEELKEREIQVTAVCPGPVKTEFFDIAERHQSIKLYKRIVMVKPEKVVRRALLDAKHGKAVSVYGAWMNAFRGVCKYLPQSFLMQFVR